MSCCSITPLSISLVLPLTGRPLRFGVNKMCVYCWDTLVSAMLAATVQLIPKQKLSGHFRELNERTVTDSFHIQIRPPSPLLSSLFFLMSRHFKQTHVLILFELTVNIHPRSIHTTCILILCSL